MQGIGVREVFGRRSIACTAQATGFVWDQVGLCWRWQNEEKREPDANQIGRKYIKEETVKEGRKMDVGTSW